VKQGLDRYQFVFIGGLHKSGTSLLFKCLRNHEQVSGFHDTGVSQDEGQHLQNVYPPARIYGGPGKFGFRPEAHLTETSNLVTEDAAQALFDQWSGYWDLNMPVLLEKSPPNLLKTRYLQALFPNAYFIILLRHPIAVSLATQRWSRTPIYRLFDHWLACHQLFDGDRSNLKNLFIVKYEDFVAYPEQALRCVYQFLGLDYASPGMEIRSDVNGEYIRRWKKNGIYTTALSCAYEKRVNCFGYSLRQPKTVHPYPFA